MIKNGTQGLFNKITLFFSDQQTEREFIKEYAARSVRTVQICLLFGAASFIAIGIIIDKKLFPGNPEMLVNLRIAGAIITLATAILIGKRSLQIYFQPIMISSLILIGIIVIMSSIAYNEAGSYNTSVSITAYMIFIHTISRLRFIYAALITWIVILTYLVILSNISPPEEVLLRLAVYIGVANVFGMIASYGIERTIRDSFIKSRLLQTSRLQLAEEHNRTMLELESVKELQFSMLPEKNPNCHMAEVAFHMSTAFEVGGDYCDYLKANDGSFTFAIGDATGHGARASTMVMAVKMLFIEYAARKTVSGFMRHASTTIKSLKLPKLYMTLAFGKISDNKLEISGAGIPPALLYKADTGMIECIILKGIPLGTFAVSDYIEQEFSLSPGDVIVLMTDGVTELYNSKSEMYETKFIENQLKESSSLSAQEIVDHIVNEAETWQGDEPLRDDMTILVLKIKK